MTVPAYRVVIGSSTSDWTGWKEIYHLQEDNPVQRMLSKHQEVFQEELGTLRGHKARIYVKEVATPQFCKAQTVPPSLRVKELDRLVEKGILEPVQVSEWAAPIVPVVKPDKSVRICRGLKLTINQVSKLDRYLIPQIEDLFATLAGGETFTKLDMSQVHQQIVLEEESKTYTVINTHHGFHRYNRPPIGITSAPGISSR